MRVLLVDDSPDNLHLASYILTKAGASVVTAESGYQAIALAMIKTFDVVLMDLEMPDMDGFETAVTLMELNPRLPVIALTAHALPEYRRRATDLGFRAFLPKPLLPHALLKSLGDLSLRAPASY
jgi:CheY-like chemotaxis protein